MSRLESLALPEVAQIVRRAIEVAFPNGLPATDEEKTDEEKSELIEWTEAQEERLSALATEFETFNGRILNVLADFYRKSKPRA